MRNSKFQTLGRMGVNLLDDPTNIADEEFVDGTNLWPVANGNLAKRPSMQHSATLLPPTRYDKIVWGGAFPQSASAAYMFTAIETFCFSTCPEVDVVVVTIDSQQVRKVYAIALDGNTVSQVLPDAGPVELFNFLDVTYVLTQSGALIIRAAQGTVPFEIVSWVIVDDLGAGGGATSLGYNLNIKPRFMEAQGDRLVLAGLGPGFEHSVAIGDPAIHNGITVTDPRYGFPPDILASNGLRFDVGFADEGPITGIIVGANAPENYPKQRAIYIFKRNAMWTLFGDAPTSVQDPLSGSIEAVKSNLAVGCVSHRTIVRTPMGLIWVGIDDVWAMPYGNEPYRIGGKLRPILVGSSLKQRWHAAYVEGRYVLSLYSLETGPSDDTACDTQWWLDLRQGLPGSYKEARWYGPQKFIPSNAPAGTFALCTNPADQQLYSCTVATLPHGDDVYTQMVSLVSMNGKSSRDTAFRQEGPRPWQAGVEYSIGDIITPTYDHVTAGQAWPFMFTAGGTFTSGATEPDWGAGTVSIPDGANSWFPSPAYAPDVQVPGYEVQSLQSGNEILFGIRTKEITAPDVELEKLVTALFMTFWADRWLNIEYSFGMDVENNSKLLSSVTMLDPTPGTGTLNSSTQLQQLDVNLFAEDESNRLIRKWDARQLTPNSASRSRSRSLQVWMNDVPGINLEFTRAIGILQKTGVSTQMAHTVSLRYTEYASITELANEIVYQINNSGITGTLIHILTPASAFEMFQFDNAHYIALPYSANSVIGTVGGWSIDFSGSTAFTPQIFENNRYLMGLLGFAPELQGAVFPGGVNVFAQAPYYTQQVASVVFKNLSLKYRAFRRNPV